MLKITQHVFPARIFDIGVLSNFISSPFLFKTLKNLNPRNIVEKELEEVINFVHGLISANQSINSTEYFYVKRM